MIQFVVWHKNTCSLITKLKELVDLLKIYFVACLVSSVWPLSHWHLIINEEYFVHPSCQRNSKNDICWPGLMPEWINSSVLQLKPQMWLWSTWRPEQEMCFKTHWDPSLHYTHTHTHTQHNTTTCTCTHARTHMHEHTHLRTHTHNTTQPHACTHTHTYTQHNHTHAQTCTHTHTHTCTHTRTQTNTHTHTHTGIWCKSWTLKNTHK